MEGDAYPGKSRVRTRQVEEHIDIVRCRHGVLGPRDPVGSEELEGHAAASQPIGVGDRGDHGFHQILGGLEQRPARRSIRPPDDLPVWRDRE